eukprot:3055927-Pleurochrysis_carterae.AAC.2
MATYFRVPSPPSLRCNMQGIGARAAGVDLLASAYGVVCGACMAGDAGDRLSLRPWQAQSAASGSPSTAHPNARSLGAPEATMTGVRARCCRSDSISPSPLSRLLAQNVDSSRHGAKYHAKRARV